MAYRKRRFIFSHDDTYHHTLMTEPREHWEQLVLSAAQERELMQYLASRREGLFDWIVFNRPARQDPQEHRRQVGIDPSKPVIGLLTNVVVGRAAALSGERLSEHAGMAGADMRVLRHAARPAAADPGAPGRDQRLPALAPADARRAAQRIPRLAPNIFVVPPESGMSTYALMSLCNAAIIYGTKMGVELTSVGVPMIVAGEAWIRNKGLTHDVSSPEEYIRILDRLPFAKRPGRRNSWPARGDTPITSSSAG